MQCGASTENGCYMYIGGRKKSYFEGSWREKIDFYRRPSFRVVIPNDDDVSFKSNSLRAEQTPFMLWSAPDNCLLESFRN